MEENNPFKILSEHEIFAHRERENADKLQRQKNQKQMNLVEKTTLSHKCNNRKKLENDIQVETCSSKNGIKTIDPHFATQVTKQCHLNKETTSSFIDKKRDIFRMQYAVKVKKDEMQRLDDLIEAEGNELDFCEKKLEEDAVLFDEFLKENDKNSVEATKIAERETRNKLDRISKVKRINGQIAQIRTDVSRQHEILKELNYYKSFLLKATPEELKKNYQEKNNILNKDSDDELALYFEDPKQLLGVYSELEEQNLSLIQNSQETEESIEEIHKQITAHKEATDEENKFLQQQLNKLKDSIMKEREKANKFELRIKMCSMNEFSQEDQDTILADMHQKVEDVYVKTIGPNEAQINTLQMLSNIENHMLTLFDQIDALPHDKYELAEKIRERDRRMKLKDEKQLQQKLHQEERLKKALERSQAQPKRQIIRPMVFRSKPPFIKKRVNDQIKSSKEDEENAYYFSF